MPSLEIVGLTKRWPSLTVSANFLVPDGELLAIAGASGCGKSTLLRMIAGLTAPDSGEVIIGGRVATALSPRERGVGMVFQDYALFPHLDVAGNVAYGLKVRGVRKRERLAEVDRLLEAVGLAGFGLRKTHQLSGGEQQRVALARTLAVRPGIVLFDEPLSSLDAALRKRLRADIRQEQRRFGLTAVYVTHDLEEALALADRVAVMDSGRVLQCGLPRELWSEPESVAVAQFMGSGPCLPILRYESRPEGLLALTETGRFPLPPDPIERAASADGQADPRSPGFLFFERTAAVPSPQDTDARNRGKFFARCLRADYIGDTVECLMEAGSERFSLRFPVEGAPAAGETGSFLVARDRLRLVRG